MAFCASEGIDISGHRSRAVSAEMLEESDYIFVMSQSHFERIAGLSSRAAGRCRLLLKGGIPDPIGEGEGIYENCGRLVEQGIRERFSELVL